jgi:hypothetical protein
MHMHVSKGRPLCRALAHRAVVIASRDGEASAGTTANTARLL